MVERIFGFITKEIKGLHEAAYLLAFFALSSQLLGLIRDRLLAGKFGASSQLDLYYASFRIPDLLFVLITFIVSGSILIPIFSEKMENSESMQKIVNSVFTVFISIAIGVCIVAFFFTKPLVSFLMPGFSGSDFETVVILTRALLLSPLLLGISQLFGSIVQTYKRFFIYAISPILYNLGIIIGILFLYPNFGLLGLIFGVVIGIVMHVLIQVPTIFKLGLVPRITFNLEKNILKKVFLLSIPRSITLTSSQIIQIFLISIASTMTAGSIAVFSFAYNLQSVPMSLIGVSYSLAAFPVLSKLFNNGDLEQFLAKIIISAKHIIFWSLPVLVLFIILRAQIVRTILGSGQFTWNDTKLVAASLAVFSISVVAQSLILLFVRGFYAMGQTKKPLFINLFSMLATVVVAFGLKIFYEQSATFQYFFEKVLRMDQTHGSEIVLLPIAFSVGVLINGLFLWIAFEKQFAGFTKNIIKTIKHSLVASAGIAYGSYWGLQIFSPIFNLNTLFGVFAQGFLAGLLGLALGLIILILLKNQEIQDVFSVFHQKIWKARPVAEGQKEL